nr:MAG TPA: Small RNA degrading nuclease 1 Recognition Motif, RNA BINDING [Caudoviricetes sp.]
MERLTYFKDGYWRVNFSGVQYQADFVDRLAAYEDIAELCGGFDRLRELAEADKDGRVLILPCKVGDTVFARLENKSKYVCECKVKQIVVGNIGFVTFAPIGAPEREYDVSLRGFGKTVFLTREESEKALQEMEGKKDG